MPIIFVHRFIDIYFLIYCRFYSEYVCLLQAIEKFGPPKDFELMQAVDIAQAVLYAVTQPKRAAVNEVLVSMTDMPF